MARGRRKGNERSAKPSHTPLDSGGAPLPASTTIEHAGSVRETLASWIVGTVMGRFYALYAAFFLGVGGLMLAVGWQAGPHKYLEGREIAALSVRVPARIVESWVALEFDPRQMGDYTNWQAFALASPCIVVEYDGGWAGPQRRAFCGGRFAFRSDAYTLHDITEVTAGVPFAWARDTRGYAVPELRMSKAALAYLQAPAKVEHATPDVHALAAVREQYDRPVDHAVVGWSRADVQLEVAIDPAHPAQSWPAGYIDGTARAPAMGMAVIALLMGLGLWFAGIRMLAGRHRWPMILFVGAIPLVWLPWFTEKVPSLVGSLHTGAGQVVDEMMDTVEGPDRFIASAPEDATFARGERVALAPVGTAYAATFGRFDLAAPAKPYADTDAALLALADEIAARMRRLDAKERAGVFAALAQGKEDGKNASGYAFLRAAREALLAPDTPAEVRTQARRFLDGWVTQPVEEPWPQHVAFAARLQLLRELTQLPPPDDVATRAGWILERGEAHQRAERKAR